MDSVSSWPVEHVCAAVIDRDGTVLSSLGDLDRPFRLASVTKLLITYAAFVAIEEEALSWDQPAGPPGATIRHLISHTSGLAFDSDAVQAKPATKRIYSNTGFDLLASEIAAATGIPFDRYLKEAVLDPLEMSATTLPGRAASGGVSTVADLARFAAQLHNPSIVSAELLTEATTVVFPGLRGVLPGYGVQANNDWGLGFEIRDHKAPHWTGELNSPDTYGHFGQTGTFLWVDPQAGIACVALTDRLFGEWAITAWPRFSDAVLTEIGAIRG